MNGPRGFAARLARPFRAAGAKWHQMANDSKVTAAILAVVILVTILGFVGDLVANSTSATGAAESIAQACRAKLRSDTLDDVALRKATTVTDVIIASVDRDEAELKRIRTAAVRVREDEVFAKQIYDLGLDLSISDPARFIRECRERVEPG